MASCLRTDFASSLRPRIRRQRPRSICACGTASPAGYLSGTLSKSCNAPAQSPRTSRTRPARNSALSAALWRGYAATNASRSVSASAWRPSLSFCTASAQMWSASNSRATVGSESRRARASSSGSFSSTLMGSDGARSTGLIRSVRRRRPPTFTVFSGGRGSCRAGAAEAGCPAAGCALAASAASLTSSSSIRRCCCATRMDCAWIWLFSSFSSSASDGGRAGAPAHPASKAATATRRKRKRIPRWAAHEPRLSMIYAGRLTSQRMASRVAGLDEGKMPTRAPFVAAVAETGAGVAGCAPAHLLDALRGHPGARQRPLDAVAQIEVWPRGPGRVIRRLRPEHRAECVGQLRRDLVAAAPDTGADGGEHPRRIRSRGALQRPHGAAGDLQAGPPPSGMHRRHWPGSGDQDRHAVRDAHAHGALGQREHGVSPVLLRGAGRKDFLKPPVHHPVPVDLVRGDDPAVDAGCLPEPLVVLAHRRLVVSHRAAEVQGGERSGGNAARADGEAVPDAGGGKQPGGEEE